ncbi:MAG TPA: CpaF family protein [Planctomycetaceae bacterium]|nr:CpaF family protein [Planctomycetaceae bacterium]HQZ64201.1 CpaF family protein [Planctomycetaceae bacterium]
MVAASATVDNTVRDFQKLKTSLHRQMVDVIDFHKAEDLSESELRGQLRSLADYLCTRQSLQLDQRQRESMVSEIMDEIYGFGPIESLMVDPDVTDILINGPDRVLVERKGLLESTSIRFADANHLMQFIHRLVGRAGRRIDESSPIVDARLPDGSRFNAVIPPLALCGPTVSIRRFGNRRLQLEDMIKYGSLAPAMADFLILAIRGRMNVIVSGGTGAGKTTLLNCMSRYIPDTQRIVTIEETAELSLQQTDVIPLETRLPNLEGKGAVTQRDLLRNALRMRPDRIIVGESRGGEVLDMLQAMNTGHDGSMSTVHANDTRETLDRMELMIALSGIELPSSIARQYIANAVDIVIHVTRLHTGQRRITKISEVSGLKDGEFQMDDIFVYRISGEDHDGRPTGSFFATGYQPIALRRMAMTGVNVEQYAPLFEARELKMTKD